MPQFQTERRVGWMLGDAPVFVTVRVYAELRSTAERKGGSCFILRLAAGRKQASLLLRIALLSVTPGCCLFGAVAQLVGPHSSIKLPERMAAFAAVWLVAVSRYPL